MLPSFEIRIAVIVVKTSVEDEALTGGFIVLTTVSSVVPLFALVLVIVLLIVFVLL